MHGISIEYPNHAGDLYLRITATGLSAALYELCLWDPINKCTIPMSKKTYRMETLLPGHDVILNQKGLYHTYCEGAFAPITFLPNFKRVGIDRYGSFPLAGWNLQFYGHWVVLTDGRYFPFPSNGSRVIGSSIAKYSSLGREYHLEETDSAGSYQFITDSFGIFPAFNPAIVQNCAVKVRLQTFAHPGISAVYSDKTLYQSYRIINYKIGSYSAEDLTMMQFTAPSVDFLPIPSHIVPSNLTDRIYESLIIPNVNNIENALGAKQMLRTISDLKRIIRKHDIKSLAELYLMWKYEAMTTTLDLKAYWTFFQKLGTSSKSQKQMVHLSTRKNNKVTRYTISFPTYTSSVLESLGLNLTSSNVWDTLPFTFVLDWFIGFGDTLQRLHEENVLTEISVNYCTVSSLVTDYVTILNGPFKGSAVRRVAYNRNVSATFPTPDVDVVFKNPIRHIFDGSALLIANRR